MLGYSHCVSLLWLSVDIRFNVVTAESAAESVVPVAKSFHSKMSPARVVSTVVVNERIIQGEDSPEHAGPLILK